MTGGSQVVTGVVEALDKHGWCVTDELVDGTDARLLRDECRLIWTKNRFRQAGVGLGSSLRVRPEIRSDHVKWLEEGRRTPAQWRYVRTMEALRLALNERFYLGLFEFEAHFAVYPPGAFYARHFDQFKGARHRNVSAILYLNEDWDEADGGALRLYLGTGDDAQSVDVVPVLGRVAVFWSEQFEHEVLPAARERCSLTGWLRTRE